MYIELVLFFFEKPLDTNQGGPFWILQLWLFAYFPELQSKCLKFFDPDPPTHGMRLANASLNPFTFAFYFSFYHQLSASPLFYFFRPFEPTTIGPLWMKNFLSITRPFLLFSALTKSLQDELREGREKGTAKSGYSGPMGVPMGDNPNRWQMSRTVEAIVPHLN